MVEIEVMVAMVSPGGSSPVIRGCILKKTRMESAGIRRTNADVKEEKEKRPSNFLLIFKTEFMAECGDTDVLGLGL